MQHNQYTREFIDACRSGDIECVRRMSHLIYRNEIDISAFNEHAFKMACKYGHLDVVKQLLRWKPTIDISIDNEYAFRTACQNGHLSVIRQLVKWKSSINISAIDEYDFMRVCGNGHLPIIKQLYEWKPLEIKAYCNENVFRYACEKGKLQIVKQLIEWNPDIDVGCVAIADISSPHIRDYIVKLQYTRIRWLNSVLTCCSDTTIDCPICRCDIKEYVETPCGHKYCKDCITSWIRKSSYCPYCRDNILC